jgi:hypothetical protein
MNPGATLYCSVFIRQDGKDKDPSSFENNTL